MPANSLIDDCDAAASVPFVLGGGDGQKAMADLRRFGKVLIRQFAQLHNIQIVDLDEKLKDL